MTTSSMGTSTTTGQPATGMDDQESKTEQAKHVAGVAGGEAKHVVGDVREQARGLLDETRQQVQDQSRTQRDRVVETLRTFTDDLEGMAEQRGGLASDAAREVARRARSFTDQIDGREPAELLEDLRSFARRRPGVFLAGAVISGVVAGRILRGTRDAAMGGTTESYDAATTQERPVAPYDATAIQEPLEPVRPVAAYPPVAPEVGSTPGRPVGGP